MPFPEELANRVSEYCSSHIPPDSWYEENLFPFISDKDIWNRLIVEHKNARFIYKIFEGLQAKDEQLLAQIKTQVIMYVSIQEEVVNYVLFEMFKERDEVKNLKKINKLTKISIPKKSKELLNEVLKHDGEEIIPCFYKDAKTDKTKVRFDQKVPVLVEMGLIDEQLASDLIKLYEYRNTVHLEAERRKKLDYDLEMGKLAYRRVEGLSIQLNESINNK